MPKYSVYLEIGENGLCMAHVLKLPGCTQRAPTREQALQALPEAIRQYHAWLRQHGEPAPSETEPIDMDIVEESSGFGPFNPGDMAALFPPDKTPATDEELEAFIRLMGYSRQDLLHWVEDLPEEVLDWQPGRKSHSIRKLLRHIGNAEEWYLSRLVPLKSLPPEWEGDEKLPIFKFLEMERRTCITRLRQIGQEERSAIHYPKKWTRNPQEPWTLRKALRRFLEHEREHTAQIQEILIGWKTNNE